MSLQITPVPKRREPWLGIGAEGEWHSYREALEAGNLDFHVVSKPAKVEIEDPLHTGFGSALISYETVPGAKVNVVEEDNRILGCVSSQYGLIQNEDAFSLLEPLCDAGAIITHAGMTEQGLAFMVASWMHTDFSGEEYSIDIMCTNSFNGSFPCGLIMTPRRIFCQNMYRKLAKNDNLLHVRHMSLAPRRIEEAKVNESKIVWYIDNFRDIIDSLNRRKLSTGEIDQFIAAVFPYPTNEEAARYETSKMQIDRLREEFKDVYVDAADVKHFGNSAVRFAHAYYDYLSHGESGRRVVSGSLEHRRLTRLISGEAVNTKAIGLLL